MTRVAETPMQLGAERAPFVMLPRWLLHEAEISDGAKVLYCILHDLVAGREGPTRPVTRGQLAECCGVSVDTVDRRLAALIGVGAVEKQAKYETRQGQLANVYWVRLSPPAATVRPAVDDAVTPNRSPAAPPAAALRPAQPRPCGDPGRDGAAPYKEEQKEEITPPTPRTAGGPALQVIHNPAEPDGDAPVPVGATLGAPLPEDPTAAGRRSAGTSLRARGLNPRTADAAERVAAERERAERLAALVERRVAERTEADRAAEVARAAVEAEGLALSAVLDDDRLARVVELVREGLRGPWGRTPTTLSVAVLNWCRAAAAAAPGAGLVAAVDVALLGRRPAPAAGEPPPALALPAAPPLGARRLRDRVAEAMTAMDQVEVG